MQLLKKNCEEVQLKLKVIQQLLDVGGCHLPEGLQNSLERLDRRTRKPEVRLLIQGPLKAGKSTLMNVLLKNPHLSHVNPYPAYPCFIEVRAKSSPDEPACVFFKDLADRLIPEPFESVEQGHKKLDILLEDFISKGAKKIDYPRIEQRVERLTSGIPELEGVEVVLVDSPGLFFKPSEGKSDYSGQVAEEYKSSDVIIFVIRWEQLFFQTVASYLAVFKKDTAKHGNLRAFVVVNCTSNGLTFDNGKKVYFNQMSPEHREKLKHYFYQHVADSDLIGELEKGTQISLEFCDLMEAAQHTFPAENAAVQRCESLEVMQKIRDYAFDDGLPHKKIHDLKGALQDIIKNGSDFLNQTKGEKESLGDDLEKQVSFIQEKIRVEEAGIRLVGNRVESLKHRLEHIRTDSSEPVKPGCDADCETIRSVVQSLDKSRVDLPEAPLEKAKEQLLKVYDKWVEGDTGKIQLCKLRFPRSSGQSEGK